MNVASPYPLTPQERRDLEKLVDYNSIQAIPEVWAIAASKFANIVALQDPHSKPEVALTYAQLYEQMRQFATGLQVLGVNARDRVALFSDNCPRWFVADQGIMLAGAVNAVRSSQADKEELLFILENSGSTALVVEDQATLNKLRSRLEDLPIQFVVTLSDEDPGQGGALKVLNFSQVQELGQQNKLKPVAQTRDLLATLIYTSGTTGKPKGVMLTHSNLISQITTMGTVVQPTPGDYVLSILPTWHSYERTVEYFLLSQGCTQIYTNIRYIKKDLKDYKPQFMVAVPRIWESIYEGVQKQFREQPASKQKLVAFLLGQSQRYIQAKRIVEGLSLDNPSPTSAQKLTARLQSILLAPIHALGGKLVYGKVREATGGRFKFIISGGGALAPHLDLFFELVGIPILVGYGLTETSPITNVRRSYRNFRGTAGLPLPGTEIQIVDPETRKPLPQGQRGLVMIRGPQVMQGYYQNPEATAKAINPEGWFDSGDLGWVTVQNDLVLTGRAKDTIVLTNGENIEPQPIEDACLRSTYVDQIMLVGQDQRSLGALIVPNLEALQQWQAEKGISGEVDLQSQAVQELFRQELTREVKNRPGYRIDDRIGPFQLLSEPFSMENGMLTQTLKIRRPVVMDRYRDMIDRMFAA